MMQRRTSSDAAPVAGPLRLNRFLAAGGVCSRRAADDLIRTGRVSIGGVVCVDLSRRVGDRDRVAVDGHPVMIEPLTYLMLHKPRGVVSTAHDERGRRTVLDLVGGERRLFPVGRLDRDTSGLLLLTNDGDLALRLTHPRYGIARLYRATVEGDVSPATIGRIRAGVELEDGLARPTSVRRTGGDGSRSVLEIELGEGRNREVRRLCEAVGHPVLTLVRTHVGPLSLTGLRLGQHRALTDAELDALRHAAGIGRPDARLGR